MGEHTPSTMGEETKSIWASIAAARPARLTRPSEVPVPESVDEVAAWAGSEDLRRTELVYAPVVWVLLPLAAIGFLICQTITDPTGEGWNITVNGEGREAWPAWVPWVVWIGAGAWLLGAVGVLCLRLSALRDLQDENETVLDRGVAHSIHRSRVDYHDGEGTWATYIALDHRLGDLQAARIYAAFEQWLAHEGLPPPQSPPVSSTTLFGPEAAGGYFILHLPVPTTAGETTRHEWMLITEPRDGGEGVVITPVPVPKKLARIRRRLRRKAVRRSA